MNNTKGELIDRYLNSELFFYDLLSKNFAKEDFSNGVFLYTILNKYEICNQALDLAYINYIHSKTYANLNNTIHNASSLQAIDQRTLTIKSGGKTFYSHHPLEESLTHYQNTCYYLSARHFRCNYRKSALDFKFNNIYDGPNESKKWALAYYNSISKQSYIEIIMPHSANRYFSIFSPNFDGNISFMILDKTDSNGCMIIETEDEQNSTICKLWSMRFSVRCKTISFLSALTLTGINAVNKLLILSNNLFIVLTKDGLLYKIDLKTQDTSCIDVKGSSGRDILLEDIIKNKQIPYLWLLLSKTYELYFLNFKQNQEKITFTKVADAPEAEKIWFDGDHILVKHKRVTMPLNFNPEGSISEQYSLYIMRIAFSKATVLKLFQDNNTAK
jgi:hypothetical protein